MWSVKRNSFYRIDDTLIMGDKVEAIQFDETKEELSFWITGRENPLIVSTKGISAKSIRAEFLDPKKYDSSDWGW